jgi:DNA-binding CsgD family transcriptional regulator
MATEYSLTRRELEVVVLLLKGMTNDEIEERLCISEGTLKTHIRHVFQKLDISNRKELLVSFTRFLASSEEPTERRTSIDFALLICSAFSFAYLIFRGASGGIYRDPQSFPLLERHH